MKNERNCQEEKPIMAIINLQKCTTIKESKTARE
jgi:hypothetical protein